MVQTDLSIRLTDDRTLMFDLFIPAGSVPRGFVVFLHGGGFTGGDKSQFYHIAERITNDTGYCACTLNYSLAPNYSWPEQRTDVWNLLSWAQREKLFPKEAPVYLAGGSPGGYIAGICVLEGPGEAGFPEIPAPTGGILINPIIDLAAFCSDNPDQRNNVTAFDPDTDRWKRNSLFSKAASDNIPHRRLLFLHGTEDSVIPFHEILKLSSELNQKGHSAEVIGFNGMEHAWFNKPENQEPVIQAISGFLREG